MLSASKANSIGMATLIRLGDQRLRGFAAKQNINGAISNAPRLSPIHQFNHDIKVMFVGRKPCHHKLLTPIDAAVRHATGPARIKKLRICRGESRLGTPLPKYFWVSQQVITA